MAAALEVNIGVSDAMALIDGGTVAAGGALTVGASGDADTSAIADGSIVDDSLPGGGVAAAAAINVALPETRAFIGSVVAAPSITVETQMAGDGTSTSTAEATSGAGA